MKLYTFPGYWSDIFFRNLGSSVKGVSGSDLSRIVKGESVSFNWLFDELDTCRGTLWI